MNDDIVEPIRRVREELIKRYGGMDGYIKHIQAMDRTRLRKAKQTRRRKVSKQTAKKVRAL